MLDLVFVRKDPCTGELPAIDVESEELSARELAEAIESTGGGVMTQGLLGLASIEEIVAELASTG